MPDSTKASILRPDFASKYSLLFLVRRKAADYLLGIRVAPQLSRALSRNAVTSFEMPDQTLQHARKRASIVWDHISKF